MEKLVVLILTITMSMVMQYSQAQKCSSYKFSSNQVFRACNDLPYLNSYLHWNYNPSSRQLQIAYRHTDVKTSTWVAWAINPTSGGMIGSQAIVAYQKSDGSTKVYTSPIDRYQTILQEGKLSFNVSDLSASFVNDEIIIFATIHGLGNDSTSLKQVWQDGPVSGDSPQMHSTTGNNIESMGTVNLLSGEVSGSGGNDKIKKRNIHGVINTVSWGIMMPLGALIARYLKVFKSADPAWFYLHVSCQSMAYIVGVAGWGTGLKLGSESVGVTYDAHRTIGIILFCLGTLQVFALLLRPKPNHKYRFYWNIYHHSIGYTVIFLSVVNIFKGFDILNPEKKWKNAYFGVIGALAFNALWLEAYTWFVVIKRKKAQNADKNLSHATNDSSEANVHGAAHQNGV